MSERRMKREKDDLNLFLWFVGGYHSGIHEWLIKRNTVSCQLTLKRLLSHKPTSKNNFVHRKKTKQLYTKQVFNQFIFSYVTTF